MSRTSFVFSWVGLLVLNAHGADLPPDKSMEIPESGKREVVVTAGADAFGSVPEHVLPEGFTLELAADAPLVTHPIMGCLDDRGRLFVGDAVGVNWNKAQLEVAPPNRVLMLEDTTGDGRFDKSTIFADKMTFPQGALWLNGSLYVASPPGIWKLTDTDDDGVADERMMIVDGFDYTGNAADIHGPFLHPLNGRLYWCHGRKGHKAAQKDGTVVDESLASGIWSCEADGSDVAWHSLGCGDNPVEVDFTPEGDVIGVQNLYHRQPRGDTIVHWLYGGVYERPDQMQAIAHLPRTLETMPLMYNFGHVAVSGSCFWRRAGGWAAGFSDTVGGYAKMEPVRRVVGSERFIANGAPLHFMVTHFNTQRVVRMELTPEGSTYKAVENEFLKVNDPDIHFTDVMEDPRDGSLLVLDTGGWFRIGCPASLMAKSEILGAVYRVRPKSDLGAPEAAWTTTIGRKTDLESKLTELKSEDAAVVRRALEWIAEHVGEGEMEDDAWQRLVDEANRLLSVPLDDPALHALILVCHRQYLVSYHDVKELSDPVALRQALLCFTADDGASANLTMGIAKEHLDSSDRELAMVALQFVTGHPDADAWVAPELMKWLSEPDLSAERLEALSGFCSALATEVETTKMLQKMLAHESAVVRHAALEVLAQRGGDLKAGDWQGVLVAALEQSPSLLLLDSVKALKSGAFDPKLLALAEDTERPLTIRLKALDAMTSTKLTGTAFEMVRGVLEDAGSTPAARIQAAEMIAASPATKEVLQSIAPLFARVGPVELESLLGMMRRVKDAEPARALAASLAQNPVLASQQESHYRQAFSGVPPEIFEQIIHPAYVKATEVIEEKKRQLGSLAEKASAGGNAEAGKAHFAAGKGSCLACHKIGEVGRAIGPDLSKIGAIRTERDLLESILFPSNTLARDYEAHVIETRDGKQILGVIKSHTAEGLLVVDAAGQEVTVAHEAITGDTTLPTSLMPMGLDQTMPEQELLDLVAYLRGLK